MKVLFIAKKTIPKEATLKQILFNCRNALRGAGGTENKRDAVIGVCSSISRDFTTNAEGTTALILLAQITLKSNVLKVINFSPKTYPNY